MLRKSCEREERRILAAVVSTSIRRIWAAASIAKAVFCSSMRASSALISLIELKLSSGTKFEIEKREEFVAGEESVMLIGREGMMISQVVVVIGERVVVVSEVIVGGVAGVVGGVKEVVVSEVPFVGMDRLVIVGEEG